MSKSVTEAQRHLEATGSFEKFHFLLESLGRIPVIPSIFIDCVYAASKHPNLRDSVLLLLSRNSNILIDLLESIHSSDENCNYTCRRCCMLIKLICLYPPNSELEFALILEKIIDKMEICGIDLDGTCSILPNSIVTVDGFVLLTHQEITECLDSRVILGLVRCVLLDTLICTNWNRFKFENDSDGTISVCIASLVESVQVFASLVYPPAALTLLKIESCRHSAAKKLVDTLMLRNAFHRDGVGFTSVQIDLSLWAKREQGSVIAHLWNAIGMELLQTRNDVGMSSGSHMKLDLSIIQQPLTRYPHSALACFHESSALFSKLNFESGNEPTLYPHNSSLLSALWNIGITFKSLGMIKEQKQILERQLLILLNIYPNPDFQSKDENFENLVYNLTKSKNSFNNILQLNCYSNVLIDCKEYENQISLTKALMRVSETEPHESKTNTVSIEILLDYIYCLMALGRTQEALEVCNNPKTLHAACLCDASGIYSKSNESLHNHLSNSRNHLTMLHDIYEESDYISVNKLFCKIYFCQCQIQLESSSDCNQYELVIEILSSCCREIQTLKTKLVAAKLNYDYNSVYADELEHQMNEWRIIESHCLYLKSLALSFVGKVSESLKSIQTAYMLGTMDVDGILEKSFTIALIKIGDLKKAREIWTKRFRNEWIDSRLK